MKKLSPLVFRLLACFLLLAMVVAAQDQANIVITGTSKYRLAVPNFNAASVASNVQDTFNQVLWDDLYQSAVVTMVGRSLYTAPVPAAETELNNPGLRTAWSLPPLSVQRLVFGSMQATPAGLMVAAYLYDVTQPPGSGRLLARRYVNPDTPAGARSIAHHLADDIIAALGFGPGIATTQIAYIHSKAGHDQQVWTMDYDGFNKQQRTRLQGIIYSPRISPDGSKVAFVQRETNGHFQIRILSLLTNRLLPFPSFRGDLTMTPAWSPDGKKLAFASKMDGSNLEIFAINADGTGLQRLTHSHNYDNFSPVWNPKPAPGSPGQIAFCSTRASSYPQIFTMNADGSNQKRLPIGGFAVSPSWSPNGQVLAFAWVRNYGTANAGNFDIYLWYFGSRSQPFVQLTHNGQRNDFPSWAPDGRHIVFESGPPFHTQLYTVAADGSVPAQLTTTGENEMPNWSWH
ncbi:MAG: translocation protein TolB [Terriglobales bacterium]